MSKFDNYFAIEILEEKLELLKEQIEELKRNETDLINSIKQLEKETSE